MQNPCRKRAASQGGKAQRRRATRQAHRCALRHSAALQPENRSPVPSALHVNLIRQRRISVESRRRRPTCAYTSRNRDRSWVQPHAPKSRMRLALRNHRDQRRETRRQRQRPRGVQLSGQTPVLSVRQKADRPAAQASQQSSSSAPQRPRLRSRLDHRAPNERR